MQSLPINSANAGNTANTWWYGNNHNSGTTDPNDPLTWTIDPMPVPIGSTYINLYASGVLNWPISTTVGMGVINTNVLNVRMSNLQSPMYALSYENFKTAYHQFDGYVFILENSLERTEAYLSTKCVMELIYRFFGDPHLRPFPFSDNELTIMYRMPLSEEDTKHVFQVDEDELKAHYKVLSEP